MHLSLGFDVVYKVEENRYQEPLHSKPIEFSFTHASLFLPPTPFTKHTTPVFTVMVITMTTVVRILLALAERPWVMRGMG
jgi:hypothetical protein